MAQTAKEIKERFFKKKYDEASEITCACGCETLMKSVDKYGRPAFYINGHNRRKYEGEEGTLWAAERRYRKRFPEKIKTYKRIYYRARKLRLIRMMGAKCHYCQVEYNGKNAPIFEFHHLDPEEKESGISTMLTSKGWDEIKEELAKCVLTCANCHNQFHGGEW